MTYCVEQLYLSEPNGENTGQFHHRISNPARLFDGNKTLKLDTLSIHDPDFPDRACACDLLVVHSLVAQEVEAVIRHRRTVGRPTVYEIPDDVLEVGSWLPEEHALHSPLLRQDILHLASLCNGLQVPSPGLAARYSALNSRVAVLDNYVPVPEEMPTRTQGFVFGWAGTRSHYDDLAAIAPAIILFCNSHPDAIFAFMGDRATFDALFSAIPSSQQRVQPFGTYGAYMDFLRTLHVGLAPLKPTAFNRGRTDVKFIEYTVAGAATLLSDTDVYRSHSKHACLFDTPQKLHQALERLYAEPHTRFTLVQDAFAWVQAQRGATSLRAQRAAFYHSFLGQKKPRPRAQRRPDSAELTRRLATAWQAYASRQYLSALEYCRDLLRICPTYRQAHWLEIRNLYALERYDEILERNPVQAGGPLYAEMMAELAYKSARRVCPRKSHQYLNQIRSPAVRLRLEHDPNADQKTQFRAILNHHPYDFFALFGLIHLLRRSEPHSPELPALLTRAELLAPDAIPQSSDR